ncbi:MAG: OmpA family protein, partial [Deltaproteobacteria bacterium]|nr:OmpA family protein [Deltaproteobacteria bacterium]
ANAQAAYDLSPPGPCQKREFVLETPPPPPPKPPPPPPQPGDADGDGIPDDKDDCPNDPENWNGYQDTPEGSPPGKYGCPDDPDSDGDGIPDSKDGCELLAEDMDGYLDDDGCPDVDNDLDGIPDIDDKECPNDPEDPDGYEDKDGCPDLDNDKDKVPDLQDMCPLTPGVEGGAKPGCPATPSLVVVTEKEIKITQQIHFEFDKAKIRPISFPVLDAVASALRSNPKIEIEVQGHTDNVGMPAYNKKLSQQRADACREYLVAQGIEPSRLRSVGYGMERPIVPNTDARSRALNRRVQFVRIEGQK